MPSSLGSKPAHRTVLQLFLASLPCCGSHARMTAVTCVCFRAFFLSCDLSKNVCWLRWLIRMFVPWRVRSRSTNLVWPHWRADPLSHASHSVVGLPWASRVLVALQRLCPRHPTCRHLTRPSKSLSCCVSCLPLRQFSLCCPRRRSSFFVSLRQPVLSDRTGHPRICWSVSITVRVASSRLDLARDQLVRSARPLSQYQTRDRSVQRDWFHYDPCRRPGFQVDKHTLAPLAPSYTFSDPRAFSPGPLKIILCPPCTANHVCRRHSNEVFIPRISPTISRPSQGIGESSALQDFGTNP